MSVPKENPNRPAAAPHYCFIVCKDDEQRKLIANNQMIFIIVWIFEVVLFHKWGNK
jgi:hypothetical protein